VPRSSTNHDTITQLTSLSSQPTISSSASSLSIKRNSLPIDFSKLVLRPHSLANARFADIPAWPACMVTSIRLLYWAEPDPSSSSNTERGCGSLGPRTVEKAALYQRVAVRSFAHPVPHLQGAEHYWQLEVPLAAFYFKDTVASRCFTPSSCKAHNVLITGLYWAFLNITSRRRATRK